ncbi:MAG: lipopolysaccharide biosynthesis protein [Propionivibrio sp.]
MSSVRRSIFLSLADNYLGMALQLGASLIIARLLTPAEIGVFAVASVFAAMASTFRDFGVAEYLIQEKELTKEKIQAALAANIAVSWLMAVLLFVSSGAVGDFYGQTGVTEVMRIQSANFLLVPFGAVAMAYHRRELNYRPILIVGLGSNVTGFVVATICAWFGFGYLSMAWSSLASIAVTVSMSLLYRPKDFPRWPRLAGIGKILHFGKHVTGIYLFGQIGKYAPEAVIGRALNMPSVAYFSRGSGLMELFNRTVLRSITPVCLPYFSQARRDGKPTKEGYLKAMVLITGIGWPFFVFLAVAAYSIIRLLYGSQWMASVPLAQILCLAAIFQLPYYLATEVLIAEGRVDQSNKLQFLVQAVRVSSLSLAFPFGLLGVCWGLVASSIAGGVIAQFFLRRMIDLRFRELLSACFPSIKSALTTVMPVVILALLTEQNEISYLRFLLEGGALTGLSWLLSLLLWQHPFWNEIKNMTGKIKARSGSGRQS